MDALQVIQSTKPGPAKRKVHGRCPLAFVNVAPVWGGKEGANHRESGALTVCVLVTLGGAVLAGGWRGPLQPKSAGLLGATRQRVGFPLKIFG